jgi:hypothetical protein
MSHDIYTILKTFDRLTEGQNAQQKSVKQLPALFKPQNISPVLGSNSQANPFKGYFVGGEGAEDPASVHKGTATSEDVVTNVKKKLGDYLQDVATAIKKDPDLVDKLPGHVDNIGPAVKTIITNDGQELKIHGNEDDGFRITVKNKPHTATFENLEHATMACEMYCARRMASNVDADYLDEKQ